MKWKVASPLLPAHSSVWEQERPQKSLCNHSWAVNYLALCTVTPCCSSATRRGHPAQQCQQRRKGFHNSCVSLSAQGNANGPARARPCLGSHGWQQCSKSGSDWERIGFLYPLSVKLRLQHRKNHLFTGAKAAECSSKHLAPDHSSREPSFPNHSYSFRERMMILKEFSQRPWGHKVAMSIFLLWGRGFLQNLLTWRSDLALGGLIPGSQFRCKTGTY